MRLKWGLAGAAVCMGLLVGTIGCGRSGSDKAAMENADTAAVDRRRPRERVEPAPAINASAVVWRTSNPPPAPEAGDVWVNPTDDMEMVFVPAGEFTLGTSDADVETWVGSHPNDVPEWFADEQPQCRVRLPAYWIGRTEVTNSQYLRFVRATGRRPPDYWDGDEPRPGSEELPVVLIDWIEASAYCKWAGGRLPTELEWEKAARGADGRFFPWGNRWDSSKCRNLSLITGNTYDDVGQVHADLRTWAASHDLVLEGVAEVGSYPAGASPCGCMDMAGNAWEWCGDWYHEDAYLTYAGGGLSSPETGLGRVCRGGPWRHGQPFSFRCSGRGVSGPKERYEYVGFRCARPAAS